MSIYDDVESGDVGDVFGSSKVLPGGAMIPIPSLTGGAGGDSGDASSTGGSVGGAAFDNSGWNITFGANSAIESSRAQSLPMTGYMPYVLAGVALILGVKWLQKK